MNCVLCAVRVYVYVCVSRVLVCECVCVCVFVCMHACVYVRVRSCVCGCAGIRVCARVCLGECSWLRAGHLLTLGQSVDVQVVADGALYGSTIEVPALWPHMRSCISPHVNGARYGVTSCSNFSAGAPVLEKCACLA